MATHYFVQFQEPGGYAFNIGFDTDEDFERFISKFKAEAERRGYELVLVKKKDTPFKKV